MRMRTSLVLSFGLFVSPCAQGGPEWIEQGDAGSDSSGSQTTTGTESLGSIKGTLTLSGASSNTAGAGTLDLEDVYLICIDNPAAFSATTEAIGAGTTAAFAQFDSQLYLFDANGLGIIGNQSTGQLDANLFDFATLLAQATDLTGQTVPGPGLYLLAITSTGQPTAGGLPIFAFNSPTEISGPDGAGAGLPLDQWALCGYDGFSTTTSKFEDISVKGTPGPNGNDVGMQVAIGFPFEYFGSTHTQVGISSNGYITFSTSSADWDEPQGELFPDPTPPNDVIAPLWNDFVVGDASPPANSGAMHYLSEPGRFIVQWTGVKQPTGGGQNRATFQVVLYEGSNCIEFRYDRVDSGLSLDKAVVGIENADGTCGYALNPTTLGAGDSFVICPDAAGSPATGGAGGPGSQGGVAGAGPLEYRIVLTGTCFAEAPLGICELNGSCDVLTEADCADQTGGLGSWFQGTPDPDGDGVYEPCDNCMDTPNADQADADADGLGDACDDCPNDAGNDADGDGVCGDVDNCPATANTDQADTDGDGAGDACDPCPNDADDDADGDGVCGDVDNCPAIANSGQADTDGDGAGDACDPCPNDADDDADGDGVCGDVDNCPATANADQLDSDGDGAGDACDPCPNDADDDADGDGVCGDVDNCPATANSDQADADGDGAGDACDACPLDADNDADGDGVCGDVDNCPATANSDQADADSDGAGDACDACPLDADNDADGDGVCGDVDNCPADANSDQLDSDSDGAGDACDDCPFDPDDDADSDGVCGDVDNCPAAANADQLDSDGDGAGDACDTCPFDADDDADGDGVCGDVDNCPATSNSDQADSDGDGAGDACDTCPLDADDDADGDGVCGDVDNCPATSNSDQADADGDGAGDACDACPLDADNDADGDGVCGDVDNCPATANADQTDTDGDGEGDACDDDDDDDTVPDGQDNDPLDPMSCLDADGDGCDDCSVLGSPDTSNDGPDNDADGACDAGDPDDDNDGCTDDVDGSPFVASPDLDGDGLGTDCDSEDEWNDILGQGMQGPVGNDTGLLVSFPAGSTFNGFGAVAISTNGYLTFSSDPDDWDDPAPDTFPSGAAPNDVIAPFWSDWVAGDPNPPANSGAVNYLAAGNEFIVQWTNMRKPTGGGQRRATFQVVLYFDTGCVVFRYLRIDTPLAQDALIGIEDASGNGLLVVDATTVSEGDAIYYCPPLSATAAAEIGDPVAACPPDATGDGMVDVDDLTAVIASMGRCEQCPEDVNGDGQVDADDLLQVLMHWGTCP